MQPAAEPPPSNASWQWLRWVCVLPAAIIFATAAYYASGIVGLLVGAASKSTFAYWVRLGLFYMPKNAAFVLAGALTAPRFRLPTALVLAAIASGWALAIHVLGQSRVGVTNYTHFAAESLGAACGVIGLVVVMRRSVAAATRRES